MPPTWDVAFGRMCCSCSPAAPSLHGKYSREAYLNSKTPQSSVFIAFYSVQHKVAIMSSIPRSLQPSTQPPAQTVPFDERQEPAVRLYPLSNYTFGVKETQPEEDPSVKDRLRRLEEHYEQYGMRRTCEGVLVCHEHNHPHVLMLQIANAFFKLYVLLYEAIVGWTYR